MDAKINPSKLTKSLGSLLAVLALAFVIRIVLAQKETFFAVSLPTIARILFVGVPVFLAANLILGAAWKMLLEWLGETRPPFWTSLWIYGKTQILKYIPGNFVSYPGRHLLGLRHGAAHGPLAGAAFFELVGLFAAASGISVLGFFFTQENNTRLSLWTTTALLLGSLASPLLLKYALSLEFAVKKFPFLQGLAWGDYSRLLGIWTFYLCFFTLAGFAAWQTVAALTGNWNSAPFHAVFFAFAIAWLAGTITPGAPAGAGVRESVMILMLSGYIGESNSALVSLLMRLVTALGDVVFYLVSVSFNRADKTTQTP